MRWPWMSDTEVRDAEWERWLRPDGVERPERQCAGLTSFITTNVAECKPLTREEWERQIECIRQKMRGEGWRV